MPSLTMPNIGEGVTEGEIVRWLKQLGDPVARDEPVVEIETDKAIVEIPSPYEGTLSSILVAEGETVPIGTAIAEITAAEAGVPPEPAPPAAPPTPEPPSAPPPPPEAPPTSMPQRVAGRYSPAVRRLAAEHGLDLALVPGSGANGRVTRQDVLRYLEGAPAGEAPATPSSAPPAAATPPAAPPSAEGERVRLSATRRAIARHMSEAHATIPVAWMAIEADVSGLVELRRRARAAFEEAHGVRLTFMPFFVRAIAQTLREHPALNASYSEDGVLRHDRLDMGIAVATDSGLLVPVLRAADTKSLAELARELLDLGERARARTLSRDELIDATLTIDNTGAFGSLISQPIVPLGQVAIVTTEAIRRELRVLPGDDGGDAFAPRSVMNLAISFDHRALDGAEAGAFMAALKARLEAIGPDDPLDAGT